MGVDSAGVSLTEVLPGLQVLHPRVLQVDAPLPRASECARSTYGHMQTLVQWRQVQQCFDMVMEDERGTGRRWDWLVRSRLDLAITAPLYPIQAYSPAYVWLTDAGFHTNSMPFTSWGVGVTVPCPFDGFAVVPRKWAPRYFRAADSLCEPNSETQHICWTQRVTLRPRAQAMHRQHKLCAPRVGQVPCQ